MIKKAYVVPHPPIILSEPEKLESTVTAYKAIAADIAEIRPKTIVVLSPHSTMYMDYFHISPGSRASGNLKRFGIEGAEITTEYDTEFVSALEEESFSNNIPAGTQGETDPNIDHGTLIPLNFINRKYSSYKTVRIGLSGQSDIDQYRFGQCVAATSNELRRDIVVIASGDLSHKLKEEGPYSFAPEGPKFDAKMVEVFESGNLLDLFKLDSTLTQAAAECGLGAFKIMAGALDGRDIESHFRSYEGPFGVGYLIADISVGEQNRERKLGESIKAIEEDRMAAVREQEDDYVSLAREAVEYFVRNNRRIVPPEEGVDRDLIDKAAGIFVSIKKNSNLRGCIGTTEPNKTNIATEIIYNAVSAASEDPRFDPISEDELGSLTYSVDVILKSIPIENVSELDPKKYGITVTSGFKFALLLPDLEGIDTVEEQVDAALRKANITKEREKKKVMIEKFEVIRHSPQMDRT